MKKRLLVIALALAMVLSFASCGGSGESAAPEAAETEPNGGLLGVVYTLPEDWTISDSYSDDNATYTIPGSDFNFSVSVFKEEFLETMEGDHPETVQEAYDKWYVVSKEDQKTRSVEQKDIKVCDTDGLDTRAFHDDGSIFEVNTCWMQDNMIYQMLLYYPMEYDANGNPKTDAKDIPSIADDLLATYEGVIASAKPGDGTAFSALSQDSAKAIGSYTFELPEGYELSSVSSNYIEAVKKDSPLSIRMNYTSEEEFADMDFSEWGDEPPTTLKEYYEQLSAGMDPFKVDGNEGVLFRYPDEDGNYYSTSVEFLAEDGMYTISLDSDAYDLDGNIKKDAVALTEDDMAVFDKLVSTLKKN